MSVLKAGLRSTVKRDQLAIEDGFNKRFDYGDIKGLAKSIAENGIKTDLKVHASGTRTKGGEPIYYITAGHRRLRAIDSLSDAATMDIPVILGTKEQTLMDRYKEQFIENDGLNLNMLEQGLIFSEFKNSPDVPMKEAEIARMFGKSQTHVADCLLLLTASPAVQKQIKSGKISPTTVVEMLKGGDSAEGVEESVGKAEKVAAGKKITKKHIQKATGKAVGKKAAPKKDEVVIKKADIKPAHKPVAPAAPKIGANADGEDKSLKKLESLLDVLEQQEGERRDHSFKLLKALIGFCKGKTPAKELGPYFIKEAGSK